MVVCYIYFTRIIAYLLKIVVPFQVKLVSYGSPKIRCTYR